MKEIEKRFKEINEANDILSNGEKRAAYDRFGKKFWIRVYNLLLVLMPLGNITN